MHERSGGSSGCGENTAEASSHWDRPTLDIGSTVAVQCLGREARGLKRTSRSVGQQGAQRGASLCTPAARLACLQGRLAGRNVVDGGRSKQLRQLGVVGKVARVEAPHSAGNRRPLVGHACAWHNFWPMVSSTSSVHPAAAFIMAILPILQQGSRTAYCLATASQQGLTRKREPPTYCTTFSSRYLQLRSNQARWSLGAGQSTRLHKLEPPGTLQEQQKLRKVVTAAAAAAPLTSQGWSRPEPQCQWPRRGPAQRRQSRLHSRSCTAGHAASTRSCMQVWAS